MKGNPLGGSGRNGGKSLSETNQSPEHEQIPVNTDRSGIEPEKTNASAAPDDFDFSGLEKRLLALQQQIRSLKIPVVILLEGWSAAGKGVMAGELLEGLDPRGYKVYVPERFSGEESLYPDMRRYWIRMPRQGDIAIFIGSWYQSLCASALKGKRARRELAAGLERVNLMERMLTCDGTLILKFFIHISRKEQKRRLRALDQKKLTRSLAVQTDLDQNEQYDQWQKLYNQVLAATSGEGAVWHVLRGENKRECKRQLYAAVLDAFSRAIEERKAGARPWDTPFLPEHEPLPTAAIPPLYAYDPQQALEEDYKQTLESAQKKLRKLQYELFRKGIPMVLAFEGWDAAGKGGSIRRLSSALDPRGFTVAPFSAPTPEEKEHHHLWRFWKALPPKGHITIFDRTWYGRVMVERIEGFCTEAQWRRAYEEINLFERELTSGGVIVRKFWLQIDPDEQLKRFVARRDDPQKQWKITDEDWRNREKWPQYEEAVGEMLKKTHTHSAPWIVVEANDKQYARIKVLRSVIAAIEERLHEA